MVTVTPRAAAWARMVSICWRLPSTSATQVRSWAGSRRSASSNMAAMTAGMSSVTLAASHLPVTTGPGRRAGLPCRDLAGAAGGDDVGGRARGGVQVVDRDDLGHPLAAVFLPGREPGGQLRRRPRGPRGRAGAQAARAHHDALAVGLQAQHPVRARLGPAGGVERLGVHRGRAGQVLDLPLAQPHPGRPLDRLPGIGERPARGLHRGQPRPVLPSACPPAGSAPHRPDTDSASASPTPVLAAPCRSSSRRSSCPSSCPLSCRCPPASGPTPARAARPRRSDRQCRRGGRQQCPEQPDRPCGSP